MILQKVLQKSFLKPEKRDFPLHNSCKEEMENFLPISLKTFSKPENHLSSLHSYQKGTPFKNENKGDKHYAKQR